MPLAWLSFGLRPGQRVATSRGDAVVRRPGGGTLRSPDGRIVVCDPYLCAGAPAPVGALHVRPPGEATTTRAARREATAMQFRTTVCTLRFAAPELGERNTGAIVHAHDVSARDAVAGVTRWEPALSAAGDPFAYGVDHGVACFIGGETQTKIATSERHHRTIERDLSVRDHHHGVIDFKGGATLEWFDSGLGDGHYAVWWGLDDAGLRRCLATDFAVFGSS
ncbi:MAG: DUF4241 domain-containing protein [Deltaproteobacteria bacterium]|nr:DUF4241 domain-containing protein [Deltaproteobacteria bacterium]